MKIGFGIGKETDHEFKLVNVVFDYASIKKAEDSGLIGHTRHFFDFVQALSNNASFIKAVAKTRKDFKLPVNGLPFKGYLHLFDFISRHNHKRVDVARFFLGKCALADSFTYPTELNKHLFDIVFYGIVSPFSGTQSTITWNPSLYDPLNSVEINIHSSTTKHSLHRFIDKNWKDISMALKRLDAKPTADFSAISARDFEIVQLRDEGNLPFPKIADRISAKYGKSDYNSRINEDSVKTAYARTKKKISNLFAPKTKR